mmetsp:Transcript_80663/g.260690  ORF Transcript_80663/g.260690 Transcript_80663/m.260690 type:complete len:317 (+) Transcript_80663:773-1723(+)
MPHCAARDQQENIGLLQRPARAVWPLAVHGQGQARTVAAGEHQQQLCHSHRHLGRVASMRGNFGRRSPCWRRARCPLQHQAHFPNKLRCGAQRDRVGTRKGLRVAPGLARERPLLCGASRARLCAAAFGRAARQSGGAGRTEPSDFGRLLEGGGAVAAEPRRRAECLAQASGSHQAAEHGRDLHPESLPSRRRARSIGHRRLGSAVEDADDNACQDAPRPLPSDPFTVVPMGVGDAHPDQASESHQAAEHGRDRLPGSLPSRRSARSIGHRRLGSAVEHADDNACQDALRPLPSDPLAVVPMCVGDAHPDLSDAPG